LKVSTAGMLIGCVLIAACAPDEPAPGQKSVQATSDTTAASGRPALPAETAPRTNSVEGPGWTHAVLEAQRTTEVAILLAVRAARHDGFERIVFEFAGATLPGYKVSYIDRPVRQCGSGEVVSLPGDGWLEIKLQPAYAHTEEGRPTVSRVMDVGLPNIRRLTLTCDFEADVTWVGGLLSPNDYRVAELRNPARLVVDVRQQ
jgi:hypothetical protein